MKITQAAKEKNFCDILTVYSQKSWAKFLLKGTELNLQFLTGIL